MRLGEETQNLNTPAHTQYKLLAKNRETRLKIQNTINDIMKMCELTAFMMNMFLFAYVTASQAT
jgi:hypothetical protein